MPSSIRLNIIFQTFAESNLFSNILTICDAPKSSTLAIVKCNSKFLLKLNG